MIHSVLHVMGVDTQQSYWYDYWSGIATQMPIPTWILAFVYLRKHNCHEARCPRIGRHDFQGTPYCTRHHPELRLAVAVESALQPEVKLLEEPADR